MKKLSVALATFNEEENIAECLDSVKNIADEIVVVDGSSKDRTVEIAKKMGAKVIVKDNPPIFHINKQLAIDNCGGEWILQLDADETVSKGLANEIIRLINMSDEEIEKYQQGLKNRQMFLRHQQLIEARTGQIGKKDSKQYAAFFIPRLNYFLGHYLMHGGVYPDGVIRLIKKNKAFLPCKDVHEQFTVLGKTGWLQHDLYHKDSPTFSRYLQRNSRYVNMIASELARDNVGKGPGEFLDYMIVKPLWWFLLTLVRHKGILDGVHGVIFSFFSALRFPRAYLKYLFNK